MRKYMRMSYLISALAICFVISSTACSFPRIKLFSDATDPLKEFTLEGSGRDKVLLIPVEGMISDAEQRSLVRSAPGTVQRIMAQLKKAEKDKHIKAVLFKINSPGGTITASYLLYHESFTKKNKTGAKIIVTMMDIATSGAYYMSLPADMIVAHPTTITGSVGVIFMRPKIRGLMDKIGLAMDVKISGKNKDMGSPFRDGTEEEEKLMQKTVTDFAARFMLLVEKHRRLEPQAKSEISTARVFTADEALKLGLVDKVGYLSDAVRESKRLADLPEEGRVVVYRRTAFPEDNYYNVAGVQSEDVPPSVINISLPDSLNIHAGFYYLWPGAIDAGR